MTFDPCEDCGGLVQPWTHVAIVAALYAVATVVWVYRRQVLPSEPVTRVLKPIQWLFTTLGVIASFFLLGNGW